PFLPSVPWADARFDRTAPDLAVRRPGPGPFGPWAGASGHPAPWPGGVLLGRPAPWPDGVLLGRPAPWPDGVLLGRPAPAQTHDRVAEPGDELLQVVEVRDRYRFRPNVAVRAVHRVVDAGHEVWHCAFHRSPPAVDGQRQATHAAPPIIALCNS